jgi:hypothetical protein
LMGALYRKKYAVQKDFRNEISRTSILLIPLIINVIYHSKNF